MKLKILAAAMVLGALAAAHAQTAPQAQAPSVGRVLPNTAPQTAAQLRDQLRERFDIVAMQGGVGLVPRQRSGDVRLVEVRDGAVFINGEPVTAKEARTRLGGDADLVFRITYLDAAGQRELTGSTAGAPANAPQGAGATAPQPGVTPPEPAAPAAPSIPSAPRSQIRRGDIVRIGGSVTVARDERVDGDVVVVGGSAEINGEVDGEVSVIGGSLNLGPEAVVTGDVSTIGGTLNRAPGSRIDGKVDDVGFGRGGSGSIVITPNDVNRTMRAARGWPFWNGFWRIGNLFGTVLRNTLLILGALVVVALGGAFVNAVAARTAADPLRAGFTGLAAEVLFVPLVVITSVVLAVSIIGIPLLLLIPFALVASIAMMFVGFTGVAIQLGKLVSTRFNWTVNPYGSVAIGVAAIGLLAVAGRLIGLAGGFAFGGFVGGLLVVLGFIVEYLAWTVGAGAVILTWLEWRRRPRLPFVPVVQPVAGSGDQTA